MSWKATWGDILDGGNPRWKVDDVGKKAIALGHIEKNCQSDGSLNIFCPLVGDDLFFHYAWTQGHSITGADLVAAPLEAIRNSFTEGEWTSTAEDDKVVWTHDSGRAVLYETDILVPRPELEAKFDVVYDKDSFGALEKTMRKPFCERLASYLKDGGIVYTEVKNKPADHPGRHTGPPYHVEKEDLMDQNNFGRLFDHVLGLGKVYDIPMPGFTQTAHIIKRRAR